MFNFIFVEANDELNDNNEAKHLEKKNTEDSALNDQNEIKDLNTKNQKKTKKKKHCHKKQKQEPKEEDDQEDVNEVPTPAEKEKMMAAQEKAEKKQKKQKKLDKKAKKQQKQQQKEEELENEQMKEKELMKEHEEEHKKEQKEKKQKQKQQSILQVASKVQEVGEPYGTQNNKPSKFEKKLRSIFTDMKKCDSFVIKNKGRNSETLVQKGNSMAKALKSKQTASTAQHFKIFKHPDNKKYMHYAIKNSEGQWLGWDQKSGKLNGGPQITWFAMLPVNENKPQEQGWLIKQDKYYLTMPEDKQVRAQIFESVPKAREQAVNRWELQCEE